MDIETKQKLFKAMNPDPSLTDEEIAAFYVDLDSARGERNHSVRDEIFRKILNTEAGSYTYSCVAGHRGCGKSTELKKLELRFKDSSQYHPVLINIDQLMETNGDVEFEDVALAIIASLGQRLQDHGITADSSKVTKVFSDIKSLLGSTIELKNIAWGMGATKLMAEIKNSDMNRKLVRKEFNQRTTSLIEAVNDVIEHANVQLQNQHGQQLVVLVDGLDKLNMRLQGDTDISRAAHLFDKSSDQLKSFQCHMVYMLPIEVLHSPEGPNIDLAFNSVSFVPMVKVAENKNTRPNVKVQAGVDVLKELIAKRCSHCGLDMLGQVFKDEETLEDLILMSGGQPRVLQTVIRSAMNDGDLPISLESLQSEYNKIKRSYDRILILDHIDVIRAIQENHGKKPRDPDMQQALMELLANRGILKYHNGTEWYAPNPLLPDDVWTS